MGLAKDINNLINCFTKYILEMITMTGSTSFSFESPDYDPANRPSYDTKEGVAESVKTLEGFCNLISHRHVAGYEREERLNEFIIFGTYALDTCGNCSTEKAGIVRKTFPDIPSVLTNKEFSAFVGEEFSQNNRLEYTVDGGNVPKPGLVCAYCGEAWDIHNCFDTVTWEERQDLKMEEFAGQTLAEVKAFFLAKNDAKYSINTEPFLSNKVYIDLSLAHPGATDWSKNVIKNEFGRMGTKNGITNDYVILPDDIIYFSIKKYYHSACNRENISLNEEIKFGEIFEKAGFKDLVFEAIINEYCQCECCAPWFNVTTELGVIKIGWRKRVIDINWSKVDIDSSKDMLSLFTKEDVTKGKSGIHAWGWDQAQDFLGRIYNYINQ